MKGIFSSKSLIGNRIILSVLCICILFIASGCDGTNYKKAIKLYENGSWDEAATIFEQLGDYEDSMAMVDACNYSKANEFYENGEYNEAIKIFSNLSGYSDSAEMIAKCKWSLFVDYIQKNKKLEYNADSSYTVTIEADGDNIIAYYSLNPYKNSAGNFSMQYEATFSFGDPVAHLNASGELTILSAQIKDTCTGEWDINSYKPGDEIEWTTYEFNGVKVDGSKLDDSATGLCATGIAGALERLTGGIENIINTSNMDFSMADLGFINY